MWLKALDKLLTNNALTTIAGKGNKIVTIHINECNEKVRNFLPTNNIRQINKDPLKKL